MIFGRQRPTASLFVQLLTLTGVAMVAAQVISLFLIFNLPPPTPDFYRLSEIEQVYRGQRTVFTERKPLEIRRLSRPPSPRMEGRTTPRIVRKLADDLAIPIDTIVIAGDRSPFSDRRVFRILRDRIEREGVREEHFLIEPFEVGIRQDDGAWVTIRPQPGFGINPWQQRIFLWFVLSALAMAPLTYVFARRLSKPIRLFAEAAERLGRDPRATPLELKGSTEIGVAVRAFNDMQERLRRYVEDRTAMVAAIAHDLRTPLTRLRFRIEGAPEEQRAKMAADIDQMEEMISATLAFVRDTSRPTERTPLELSSLLDSLCDEMAETGADTEVTVREEIVVDGDPMALRRLFSNLLDNAVKFGHRARVRVFHDASHAVVEIDDNGPGIPPSEAERVFDPFYRREPSRSRQTGGIGLGLAVVRSIARAHGGDVELINRDGKGLTARVNLPL
jgi:two-component system OmpR family sensor kinase